MKFDLYKRFSAVLALLFLLNLAGVRCGSGALDVGGGSVTLSQTEVTVEKGGTYQFTADVVEPCIPVWSVQCAEGESCGSIDESGLYSATSLTDPIPLDPKAAVAVTCRGSSSQSTATVHLTPAEGSFTYKSGESRFNLMTPDVAGMMGVVNVLSGSAPTIYWTWSEFTDVSPPTNYLTDNYLGISDDGFSTFRTTKVSQDTTEPIRVDLIPFLSVNSSSDMMVLYSFQDGTGDSDVMMTWSDDGGATFPIHEAVSNEAAEAENPGQVVASSNDVYHFLYSNQKQPGVDDDEVYYCRRKLFYECIRIREGGETPIESMLLVLSEDESDAYIFWLENSRAIKMVVCEGVDIFADGYPQCGATIDLFTSNITDIYKSMSAVLGPEGHIWLGLSYVLTASNNDTYAIVFDVQVGTGVVDIQALFDAQTIANNEYYYGGPWLFRHDLGRVVALYFVETNLVIDGGNPVSATQDIYYQVYDGTEWDEPQKLNTLSGKSPFVPGPSPNFISGDFDEVGRFWTCWTSDPEVQFQTDLFCAELE